MDMKNRLILAGLLLSSSPMLFAQGYFEDDIYYNPKKSQTSTVKVKKEKKSNYIANMGDMDVDSYNRRNQYYLSPADTIGSGMENGEDFVYTQKIQKFYNPTIVVDNADILGDVLANSYGNVEIQINDAGYPVFVPGYSYGWPYYSRWGFNSGPWGWSVGFYDPWYNGWGWGPSWAWGPSWSWNWGPSWAWGPSWSWGPSWAWGPSWGPGWGPGPGFGPGWGGRPHPVASWNPNGNRPVGPRPGWSASTRPTNNSSHRVPAGTRPGNSGVHAGSVNNRPGYATGVVNNNGKWQYVNGGHRVPSGSVNGSSATNGASVGGHRTPANRNNNATVNTNTNRTTRETTNSNSNRYNNNTNHNNNRSTTTNRSTNRNTFNSGSFGGGSRSGGGSFGGGSRGGGGSRSGGGRHR